ncbi:TetR/AcrR family transcriptional regulator [Cryptosporangium phraense]|uniref:TetR/AcrR family transcriptional regulator n=1 Tax=Cryptosporangium phraense TaxID=2593070 RepID=A0A545ALH1_9ACTN|nr:TetR/AcrR family transcriptional regulator [Cryptosporangium phraense]TQS42152.1 TetR/AcrR family transcriptional regulator [Cryptosporangium phraense]
MSKKEPLRQRIVEVTLGLLASGGRSAVTTRAVAAAAETQPHSIYRLFGDMDGLLDAVAGHGFQVFLDRKSGREPLADPVDDLRRGWDLVIEFAVAEPALFALLYGEPGRGAQTEAFRAGITVLRNMIGRVAAGGRLRVSESMAVAVINASARGAALTWLSTPPEDRDEQFLDIMRSQAIDALVGPSAAPATGGPASAARAVLASLPGLPVISDVERPLFADWLRRVAGD